MNLDKLIYRSMREARVSGPDLRTDVPFRLTMSQDTVLVLRRVTFTIQNLDFVPGVDNYAVACAISSADLIPQTDVADASAHPVFMNRNDFVVAIMFRPSVITAIGVMQTETRTIEYEHDQIILPRSPSLVFMVLTSANTDDWEVECTIEYEKTKVNKNDLTKLMMRYKSIKPASIPRVIDE